MSLRKDKQDRWIRHFLSLVNDKDPQHYALYPLKDTPTVEKPEISVEVVSPVGQTNDQAKEEVKREETQEEVVVIQKRPLAPGPSISQPSLKRKRLRHISQPDVLHNID